MSVTMDRFKVIILKEALLDVFRHIACVGV